MNDDTGPSFENLLKLHQSLPALAHSLTHKKITGKGKPVGPPQPRKTCPVCCKMFDFISSSQEVHLKVHNCEECDKNLKAGWIAVVGGDMFAWLKNDTLLPDMAGTIQHVEPWMMESIRKRGIQLNQRNFCHNGKSSAPQDHSGAA